MALDEMPVRICRVVERTAMRLLAGVGRGERRWQYGSGANILHVRRCLSDAEIAALAAGPPAIHSAGGGEDYIPRTCAP